MARLDAAIFIVSAAMMALKPLLLHLTGDAVRREAVPPATFQLAVEGLKAWLCATTLLARRCLGMSSVLWKGWRHTATFAVPAAVYLIMNVLTVVAARLLHPPTLQLVASIKILFTAIASCLLMSKNLHQLQWLALLLLTAGVALGGQGRGSSDGQPLPEAPLLGLLLITMNCVLSAVGGVFTEMALKRHESQELTIFATNLHMSIHSLAFNSALQTMLSERIRWELLQRSDLLALTNEALNGILISLLMRRIDAIAKNYVFSVSVFTTAGMSAMVLGYWPPWEFYLGASICAVSMVLYARGGHVKAQ